MEIEINFRLDENGRTASTAASVAAVSRASDSPLATGQLDYSYRVAMTDLSKDPTQTLEQQQSHQEWLDDILFDCEISDSGLMPRTFWVPAQDFTPRCALEQFALDIFHHHVPKNLNYDVAKSGAEWWCQLRPSPEKTGRYAMHCPTDNKKDRPTPDPFAQGISMHVDKDEELRILTGGTTYIHPHLSTVTYLTNFGSPTMIMNVRVHPLEGTWVVPDESVEGFVSWPALGKHISFDGRYLHAAPCDLMEEGSFEKQIQFTPVESDQKQNKILTRRHRRVTFLVNIWLNHHPFDVKPFPDTMVDMMSGQKESDRRPMFPSSDSACSSSSATHTRSIAVTSTAVTEQGDKRGNDVTTKFEWPLGDESSNERLELLIPLSPIRREALHGGNVSIEWKGSEDGEGPFNCMPILRIISVPPSDVLMENMKIPAKF